MIMLLQQRAQDHINGGSWFPESKMDIEPLDRFIKVIDLAWSGAYYSAVAFVMIQDRELYD